MNAKQSREAKVLANRHKESDLMIERLADVIMQNKWLAAEITHRWLEKNGYYMTPKAEADAEFVHNHPEFAPAMKRAQARFARTVSRQERRGQ